jgi:hypothetical protein
VGTAILILVVLGAVGLFVADRYGTGSIELGAVVVLALLDVGMMAGLVAVAGAENCEGTGRWECSRLAGLALVVGIVAATFSIGALLVRGLGRDG